MADGSRLTGDGGSRTASMASADPDHARETLMRRPADTSEDARAWQVRALRAMGPEGRLAAAATMSDEIRSLAESGVRSRHPEFGPAEVPASVADILLGRELASTVRRAGRRDPG
jgi:hypothetical protein